jgi:Carboxypeptidase regulatory-like domain
LRSVDEQTTGRSNGRQFAYAIAVIVATVVGISLFSDLPESPRNLGDWSSWLLQNFILTLLVLILLTGVITFVEIFACPLPDEGQETVDGAEGPEITKLKQRWMTFAYGFMLFALFAAVVPFLFDIRSTEAVPLRQSPISVLVGCAEQSKGIPGELYCARFAAETSVEDNSAGKIFAEDGFARKSATETKQPRADKDGAKPGGGSPAGKEFDEDRSGGKSSTESKPHSPAKDGEKSAKDAVKTSEKRSAETDPTAGTNSAMWVINLGGEVTSCKPSGSNGPVSCRIQGGLVVPVYLVMLALFGGAVSLTRRVPEYQKQAADDYVATANAPKLRPHRLREYLIFQIVQFISAPFIAVVAYYVVAPTAMSATVALGFAAGFASEAILLMIRAAVDKIKPAGVQETSAGSVSGYVTDLQGQIIEGAEVQILDIEGKPTESTDTTGCFVLNEIPAGEHALKVRDSKMNKAKIEQIRIPAGAAVICKLTL